MRTILAIIGVVFIVLVGVAIITSNSSDSNSPTPTGVAPTPTAEPNTVKFGTAAKTDSMTVTATKPKKKSQQFAGTQYCSTITYKNTSDSQQSFNPFDWKFRTEDGVESSAGIPFGATKTLNSGELRPGGTVKGDVCSDSQTENVTELVYNSDVTFTN